MEYKHATDKAPSQKCYMSKKYKEYVVMALNQWSYWIEQTMRSKECFESNLARTAEANAKLSEGTRRP